MRRYLAYFPDAAGRPAPVGPSAGPGPGDLRALVPAGERQAFDMRRYVRALVDDGSFLEIQPGWAREITVGLARLDGRPVGVVANNSMFRAGVLFVDSSDKAAAFVRICGAFGVPLVFLADVPGFMVGAAVERQGIIRHGAAMIAAVTRAAVPKICVVVRKAYGAGLYAMAGPGFAPTATLALPTAKIAVMGAEAAVNAVWANRDRRAARRRRPGRVVAERRAAYETDIDVLHLAAELVVDDIVEPEDLRAQLIARLAHAAAGARPT